MQSEMFSGTKVNLGRQPEFDWAKTLVILFMIMVHVYQYVSGVNYEAMPANAFRNTIEFLGGPLAAPVFMFAMGMGMIFGHKNTPKDFMVRGIKLVIAGYALNFIREVILIIIVRMSGGSDDESILFAIGNIDILHFAGMAFLTIGLMRYLNLRIWQMGLLAVAIQPIGALLSQIKISAEPVQYLLDLFIHANEGSSFPLLAWLIYPVFGMAFATVLQHVNNKDRFYNLVFLSGMIGLAAISISYTLNGYDLRNSYTLARQDYWNQTLIQTAWILMIILVVMPIYYFISQKIQWSNMTKLVSWISANLNTIYVFQWLLIDFAIARLTMNATDNIDQTHVFIPSFVVLILSLVLTWGFRRLRKKKA